MHFPFFYCLQVKSAHIYKPPAGLTDKQRLSSELDKLFISRHIRHIKNKNEVKRYVLHNENRKAEADRFGGAYKKKTREPPQNTTTKSRPVWMFLMSY